MKIRRKKTKVIKVGKVKIGGSNPISIQSMLKVPTKDTSSCVKEIQRLEKAGCDIVRIAVKDLEEAKAIKKIKKRSRLPIVADIHFDYRLAIASIESGVDKIRLNPGNISKKEEIRSVVTLCKKKKIPIRIGLNSGSVSRFLKDKNSSKDIEKAMVKAALSYIKLFEKEKFYDIIVSLKTNDVLSTISAYRMFSEKSSYPVHLGVTASGPVFSGLVKSSIGIGSLLLEGIGDTIRVSLTGDSSDEVKAGQNIIQALGIESFRPEVLSCPTCGRCGVDLKGIVDKVDKKISKLASKIKKYPTIAIMGCEVNGPGEAKHADFGIAFGKKNGVLFKKGKVVKRVSEKNAVNILLKELI